MRRKADLPTKICATCGRPMTWRKSWAKVWDEVRHCSERCRAKRNARPADALETATPPEGGPT